MTEISSSGLAPVDRDTSVDWRARFVRVLKGRSLAECIDSGRDNILYLRLLAALLVILGHSGPFARPGAWASDPIQRLLPQTASHLVGLMIFFTISGFLISLSFVRRPDLPRFLRARVLRLWPALAVCVLAWAFVIGPVLTDLPLRVYFTVGDAGGTAYGYALSGMSIFTFHQFLPGLFSNNPIPHYVNGSLWTIPVEATMYLWVAGAGTLRLFRFPWLTSIAIAGLFSTILLWPLSQGAFRYTEHLELVIKGFFGAGAIACLLRKYLPVSTGVMVVITIACLLARGSAYETSFTWLAIGYFVLWFSYVPRIPPMPWELDLSYGTYLWGFPVQQTVISMGVRDPLTVFAIVTPIVLTIAMASWLFVEKPALRLKDWHWRRPSRLQPA